MLYSEIQHYLDQVASKPFSLTPDRHELLDRLAQYIAQKQHSGNPIKLSFICTHNSRRSHLGQTWAYIVGYHVGLPIESYSGGTEATAFHPNAIKALGKAGVQIEEASPAPNPYYSVSIGPDVPPLSNWSKVFTDSANPSQHFAAIMTCSDADENSPFVPGAELRIALTYEDPKLFDGTPKEEEAYEERSRHIAFEMLLLFQKVKELVS